MSIFHSIILGLLQGASEFLPISSSAHLVLAPYLFGFSDPGLGFDVALHFGTLLAVVLFFWRDWLEIFELAIRKRGQISKNKGQSYGNNILYFLILATVPGAIAGFLLESYAKTSFRSPILIAATLSIVGLVLYLSDKYHIHTKKMEDIGWMDSLIVGLAQALAIVPGVSRSGATITAGLLRGLSRRSAARFSFLLSTPIILGAAIKQAPDLISSGVDAALVLAVASSALSGYFAIKYLLRFVERSGYAVFFWYRLGLAAVILAASIMGR